VAPGRPQARPGYGAPLPTLRERFPEVWSVDGSRWEAGVQRLTRRREVRARVLPGGVTACSAVSRGMTRPLDCHPEAAAGALSRATAARAPVPQGPVLVGERWYGGGRSWRP
jgi:hypothetical protein